MAREADDPRLRAEEARLARRAADGDGAAFAQLYDRYEQRIYTFCHRLVGSEHDAADATQDAFVKVLQRLPKMGERELNFGAYLFTAARNASYDVIGRRKKADAVDEIPEFGSQPVYGEQGDRLDLDPEGAAMLGSLQEAVRDANARLPERQREVLALRELEELSYDEIADVMGMNRNSVAQLISRARIKLRDELRGSALAAVAATTPEDERAATLIAERMDGELADDADREWLEDYLRDNERGRAMVESMLEAGTSYRAWLPIVPVLWLRDATVAKAAEAVGADWSDQLRGADGGAGAGGGPGGAGAGTAAGVAAQGPAADGAERETGSGPATGRRRRAAIGGAVAGILLLLVLGSQLVIGGGDPPEPAAVVTTPGTTDPSVTTAVGGAAAQVTSGTSAKARKRTTTTKDGEPVTVEEVVVTTPAGAVTTIRRATSPGTPPKSTSTERQTSSTKKKQSSAGAGGGTTVRPPAKTGTGSTPAPPPAPAPTPDPAPTPTPPPDPAPAPEDPPERPVPPSPTTPPTRTTPPPTRTAPSTPPCPAGIRC